MLFSSVFFLFVYLPITVAVYYFFPARWRNAILFAVSLVFYGWGEPIYLLLMLFSIAVNYLFGLLIERLPDRGRLFVLLTVIINLALLGVFKYSDFVISNVNALTGLSLPLPGLELPIGISFYTFQAMSYPIDVYRRDVRANRSFVSFGAFVAMFPQLIAGPIIRYKDVALQLDSRRYSLEKFSSGVLRFTVGLCKKVLLANSIGSLWDSTVASAGELSAMSAVLGIVAFSFQIYFDFSGYSDMAVGLGRMLGFEFIENFNYPYIAKSITDFWRRWHISLSQWFRDYVYIPLGGNRVSKLSLGLKLLIVWSLTGIWHGASWNFLFWGLWFAILLIAEKFFLGRLLDRLPSAVRHIYTLVLVGISWMIFAIDDLSVLTSYTSSLIGSNGFADGRFLYDLRSFGALLVILIIASTPIAKKLWKKIPETPRHLLGSLLMVAGLVLSTAYLVDSSYNPFLYFRF